MSTVRGTIRRKRGSGVVITAPTVDTPTKADVTATTATLGGTVSNDGGAPVTDRGTVWGTSANPTGNSLSEGSGTGVFSHARTGLPADTLIYYRAYATNSVGASYSADDTFTTPIAYLLQGTGASKTFETGTANYTETDGSIAATGGVFDVTAQSTPAWGDLGWVSSDINAIASRAFIFTLNGAAIETTELIAGWTDNGLVLANFMAAIKIDGSGNVDIYANGVASATGVSTVTNSNDEKFAIIKGGYDASGVPMDAAANIASYPYGASFYYYDGSNWQLIYRTNEVQDTGMDYPAMSFYDYGGDYDAIAVADVDLSALMTPLALDTFTGANGTNINGKSLDVGGTWSMPVGAADIQSNRMSNLGGAGVLSTAVVDVGEADVFIEFIGNVGNGSSPTTQSKFSGSMVRWADSDNRWLTGFHSITGAKFIISEKVGGSTVTRASGGTVNVNTDYNCKTVFDDELAISWKDDSITRLTYGSASALKTVTEHGPMVFFSGTESVKATVDFWSCWARGNGGEYADLGSY